MMELLNFILITAGITYGVTNSKLFKGLREKLRMMHAKTNSIDIRDRFWWFSYHVFTCPLCFGFYASVPVYLLVFKRLDPMMVGYMFIGSITSYIIHLIIQNLKS